MAADSQPDDVELVFGNGVTHRKRCSTVGCPRHLIDIQASGQFLDAQPGAEPGLPASLYLPQIVDEVPQSSPEAGSLIGGEPVAVAQKGPCLGVSGQS